MKKDKKKILLVLLIALLSLILIQINTYAHSGRTDSSGGHRDNKNKSGLGSYHYHCGGYPAHLHENGVCPYTSSETMESSADTSNNKPNIIEVEKIQINENVRSLEVGKSKTITAMITPSNATNKSITWKSSDTSIAEINEEGKISAKKVGTVDIIATSSNGKTSTIKLNVKEKAEKSTITNTLTSKPKDTTNTVKSNQEDSNPLGGVLALGVLGGGGYWGYKKYKKSK